MKSLIPVVMAGILGIYGMIVAVIISQRGMSRTIKLKTTLNIRLKMLFRIWHRDWSAGSAASYCLFDLGCGLLDRYSGRCGHQSQRTPGTYFCGTDPHSDFRVGFGLVRADRVADFGVLNDDEYSIIGQCYQVSIGVFFLRCT